SIPTTAKPTKRCARMTVCKPPTATMTRLAVAMIVAMGVGSRVFAQGAAEPQFSAEQLEFFEREIAPILKANCVQCHGGEKKVPSGLYLTSRAGVLKGGENGPVVSLE